MLFDDRRTRLKTHTVNTGAKLCSIRVLHFRGRKVPMEMGNLKVVMQRLRCTALFAKNCILEDYSEIIISAIKTSGQ
jgi:hypothetical protein